MESLYIGGEYVSSRSGVAIEVENPATEEILAAVPEADAADIDRAVEAARRAQRDWRRVDGLERVGLLHRCADRLEEHADELAVLLTREGGKTLKENRDEIDWSVTAFRHLGEVARASRGRVVGSTKAGQMNLVLNEPLGVVVHILPSRPSGGSRTSDPRSTTGRRSRRRRPRRDRRGPGVCLRSSPRCGPVRERVATDHKSQTRANAHRA
jgi:acyl-CoA reductase-like NAD-dependent aldehyde dehydrogenase